MAGLVQGNKVEVLVFPDGYARVDLTLNVTSGENISIALPVYEFSNLSVKLNGREIHFILNENGIVVYPNENGTLEISYLTPELTEKHGKVWRVNLPFNFTKEVTLPKDSVIVGLSGIPLAITENSVIMPKGNQYVEYVLPHIAEGTKNNTQVLPTLVAFLIGALLGRYWRRIKISMSRGVSIEDLADKYNLNKDEQEVLLYIAEKGGRAKQAEIRNDLGIPRTTTWRILRRLEKEGLVKLSKVNNETLVELKIRLKIKED